MTKINDFVKDWVIMKKDNILRFMKNFSAKQALTLLMFIILIITYLKFVSSMIILILAFVTLILFMVLGDYEYWDKSGVHGHLEKKRLYKKVGLNYDKIKKQREGYKNVDIKKEQIEEDKIENNEVKGEDNSQKTN